ncbi:MAG: hypothetical protein ACYC6M_03125 [Terriglobales bacterium]
MRVRTRRLGQIEEIAGSTASSYDAMTQGSAFWPSVGVGVFTGLLVWFMHRGLDHIFPRRARS